MKMSQQRSSVYKRALAKSRAQRAASRAVAIRQSRAGPRVNRTLVLAGLGFPKKMMMTHRYNETGTFQTGAAGVMNSFSRVLNGLFAPGGAHQPYYFDQMAALYNHFCVLKATVTWRACVYGGDTACIGMYINDDTTVTPNLNGLNEQFQGAHTLISKDRGYITLKRTWELKKNFDRYSSSDPEVIGSGAANPVEQSCMTFYIDNSIVATQTSVLSDMTIDYTAEWTELKDIAQS